MQQHLGPSMSILQRTRKSRKQQSKSCETSQTSRSHCAKILSIETPLVTKITLSLWCKHEKQSLKLTETQKLVEHCKNLENTP